MRASRTTGRDEGVVFLPLMEQSSIAALTVSQRACILENSHVLYSGSVEELSRSAEIKQEYLGI